MPPLQSETRTTHQYESKSRTIGVLGLRTGPGTLRNGGTPLRLSHRARILRTPPRMNHHRMCPVTVDSSDQSAPRVAKTVQDSYSTHLTCLSPERKPYPRALTALTFRSTLNLPILLCPPWGWSLTSVRSHQLSSRREGGARSKTCRRLSLQTGCLAKLVLV